MEINNTSKYGIWLNRLAVCLVSLLSFVGVYGQSKLLTIFTKDGQSVQYSFNEKPVITFDSNELVLTTDEVIVTYPLHNFRKFTINDTDSIVNVREITINDDELLEYTNESIIEDCIIKYIRTFTDFNWQALYVPFELPTTQLNDDFEIAAINNFHQYDDDNDGIFDRTVLEIRSVTSGQTLLPNYPYLIKAKSIGTKVILLDGVVLYPTEIYTIDCSSVEIKYEFTGTYSTLQDIRSSSFYTLINGQLCKSLSNSDIIPPFRWYMHMQARNGQFKDEPIILNSARILIRMIDEEENTGVEKPLADTFSTIATYSINGTKVERNSTPGIYIMRMNDGSSRKVFIK